MMSLAYPVNRKGGGSDPMNTLFADTLRKLRTKKGLSQVQLANLMFVNKTTISKWESGSRLPDASMITRLARALDVDVSTLFSTASESDESPNIIMVDDNKDILTYSLQILEEVVPNAMITAYNWPQRGHRASPHRRGEAEGPGGAEEVPQRRRPGVPVPAR